MQEVAQLRVDRDLETVGMTACNHLIVYTQGASHMSRYIKTCVKLLVCTDWCTSMWPQQNCLNSAPWVRLIISKTADQMHFMY